MSLHTHHNHHVDEFLQKKEMNEIYLSYGIQNFALGAISVFVPIYLFKLGYSIPMVLLFYYLLPLNFVIFAYAGARAVSKLGIKWSMFISTVFTIALFVGLRVIDKLPWLFFILPTIYAIKAMLYNYSFYLSFIQHSDRKHRGKQVSALQASALIGSLLSPFFGGLVIRFFSYKILFIIGSALLFVSLIPLLFFKDTYQKVDFDKANLFKDIFRKENRPVVASFSGFAIEDWIGFALWPIFLTIIAIGTESIGAIASLSAFLTFLVFYFVGKLTDKRDRRELIKVGTILYFFGLAGRIFTSSFSSALFVDTYKKITGQILQIPWISYSFDLAAKDHYFKFIVQREIIFDLSRVIVGPFIILIFIINFHPFLISFTLAAFFSLFYMSLNRAEIIVPAVEQAAFNEQP